MFKVWLNTITSSRLLSSLSAILIQNFVCENIVYLLCRNVNFPLYKCQVPTRNRNKPTSLAAIGSTRPLSHLMAKCLSSNCHSHQKTYHLRNLFYQVKDYFVWPICDIFCLGFNSSIAASKLSKVGLVYIYFLFPWYLKK